MRHLLVLSITLFSLAAASADPAPGCREDPGGCVTRCAQGDAAVCAEVVPLLGAACERRNALACYALAHLQDEGTPMGLPKGAYRQLLERSCALDLLDACNDLGAALAGGIDGEKQDARAIELWRAACAKGEETSCTNLGGRYRDGRGVAQDDREAVRLFRRGCDLGDGGACHHLGGLLEVGVGGPVDKTEARASFKRACDLGDTNGCQRAQIRDQRALALAAKEAARRERDCDRGWGIACYRLALLLTDGYGVRADPKRATAMHERACALKYALSCEHAALAALEGMAQKKSLKKAKGLLREACEGGYTPSCHRLAVLILETQGRAGEVEARAFFKMACDAGHADSCAKAFPR